MRRKPKPQPSYQEQFWAKFRKLGYPQALIQKKWDEFVQAQQQAAKARK